MRWPIVLKLWWELCSWTEESRFVKTLDFIFNLILIFCKIFQSADKVFGNTLYGDDDECLDIWFNYPPHPLQEQEPLGDRKWISQFPLLQVLRNNKVVFFSFHCLNFFVFLQKLKEFEEATGIEFKHIRLLARAFTDRSVGYTNLTLWVQCGSSVLNLHFKIHWF